MKVVKSLKSLLFEGAVWQRWGFSTPLNRAVTFDLQNVAKIRFILNEIRPLTLAVLVFICVLDASQVSFSTVLHYFLFIFPTQTRAGIC